MLRIHYENLTILHNYIYISISKKYKSLKLPLYNEYPYQMLLSVQNHLFGATLCHSSGMRQCYMNFYLKIQIYSYPIRLYN